MLGVQSFTGAQAGEPPRPAADPALTNWLAATTAFQRAGALIGGAKYPQARSELESDKAKLPAPYAAMAEDFRARLNSALGLSTNSVDARRDAALLGLCTDMRAYAAALELQRRGTTNVDELGDEALYAWRLAESGDTKAALAEYRRRFTSELVEYFQTNWQDQIQFLEQRPANLTNTQFSVALVKGRYLKGLEAPRDYFGALTELTRVAPFARSGAAAAPVYQLISKCFDGLSDDAGQEAWQEKFLQSFKSDPEVCGLVYVDRGQRASIRKDMKSAETQFRIVTDRYTNSSVYGDALYGLGWVLQEEQRYDEAMPEYQKLFSANVNEGLLDPETSDDYPNYKFKAAMRISECFEAKKDLPDALKYALQARDRFVFISYCKDCTAKTRANVADRVATLEKALKNPQ